MWLDITHHCKERRISKLASEVLAIKAASGLVNLMSNKPMSGAIKDSTVAQISAALFYKTNVMAKLASNSQFQAAFRNVIFDQVAIDFGDYVDAKARTSPKAFHHVYEWGRTGDDEARLFKLKKLPADGLSLKINYELIDSKSFVPSENSNTKHVFVKKASVMEEGKTVVIAPRFSERLVFDVNGYTVFMPKGESVTVRKPGGAATKNSFFSAYRYFFTGQLVNMSIKKSGFQKLFNSSLSRALGVPSQVKTVKYSFSPNQLANEAEAATSAAFARLVNG
jgi:hypothetical protein